MKNPTKNLFKPDINKNNFSEKESTKNNIKSNKLLQLLKLKKELMQKLG